MQKTAAAFLALLVTGCQAFPHDGPSAREVEAQGGLGVGGYSLIDLDYARSQLVAANAPAPLRVFSRPDSLEPLDIIHEGDGLSVTIYQAGAGPSVGQDRSSDEQRPQSLNLTVDSTGAVAVPYAGSVRVAGLTPVQAGAAIQAALAGRLVGPQVLAAFSANLSNSVTVVGEVRNGGRVALQPSAARILDVIALSGGATRASADVAVTLVRGDQSATTTLAALMADQGENVRLQPRDQIRLAWRPRKFSTFGAFARAAQIAIEDDHLTLAAAISRMGGLDPNTAKAESVLLFRFERPEVAQALNVAIPASGATAPIIYRLNLREPTGYFIANTFEVRDGDLIYAPRADTAELRKFFELVSTMSQVAYNVRVTSVLR